MIQATVTYNTGPEQVPIPDKWEDLTFGHWSAIVPVLDKPDEVLALLLGGSIESVPAASLERLRLAISFLYDTEPAAAAAPAWTVNVGRSPWQKLVKAQAAIQKADGQFAACAVPLVKIYTGQDIAGWPAAEGLAQAWHIWQGVNEFVAKYEELGKSYLTPEEEDATILPNGDGAFDQFGWFASVAELAGRNPLQYDALLREAAVTIYQTMLYLHRCQYVRMKSRKNQPTSNR